MYILLLFAIPKYFQPVSLPTDINLAKSETIINQTLSIFKKCQRDSSLSKYDLIFLVVSIIFTIILLIFSKSEKSKSMKNNSSSSSSKKTTKQSKSKADGSVRTKRRQKPKDVSQSDDKSKEHERIPMLEFKSTIDRTEKSSRNANLPNDVKRHNEPYPAYIKPRDSNSIDLFFHIKLIC